MKKWKKIFALLLVAALAAGLLAACGNAEQAPQEPNSGAPDVVDNEPEEITDIQIYCIQQTGTVDDVDQVAAAINEITGPEIGVHVSLQMFDIGSYISQLGLTIAGGEGVDIAYFCFASAGFSTLYASNQIMDITELLNQYGQDVLKLLGTYINGYSIDGHIYGLPPYRVYNSAGYLIMRKDILEELGMVEQAQNLTSWAEVEALFAAVAGKYPGLYPVGTGSITRLLLGGETFEDAVAYDDLGDTLFLLYTDQKTHEVSLVLEQEAYEQGAKRAAEWMEKGWMWPDATFSDEHVDSVMSQNVLFSSLQNSEIGVETSKEQACGYEVIAAEIKPIMVTSADVQKFGVFVPSTADEPEAAVKFLNLWYTDSRVATQMIYGIEGEHYVMLENGEAAYPDGITSDTVGFHTSDFMAGNQFLLAPWQGAGADLRERGMEMLKSAETSAFLGFSFNSDGLNSNVLASLTSAFNQYYKLISNGGYTPEVYQQYIDELYAGGLSEYIEAYQTQLDAWIAANP